MKNRLMWIVFTASFSAAFGQVGVGTTDPKSSLDVEATSVTAPTNEDGILIPRMNEFPATDPEQTKTA